MGKRLKSAGWGIIATLIIMGAVSIMGGAIIGGMWFMKQAAEHIGDIGAFAAWLVITWLCGAVLGMAFGWGND